MSTELAPAVAPAETPSVELDKAAPQTNDLDHKRPEPEKKPEKPESRREAIERAKAELDAKAEKPAEKDPAKEPEKVEAKPEPKVEAKEEPKTPAEKSDGVERAAQEAEKPKSSEGKGHEAPARFLPKAKELWQATPNPVKGEVQRLLSEFEEATKQHEVATREWSQLEQYDRMAKANGTTVKEALDRYTSVDRLLRTEPIKGIEEVIKIAGYTPQQYANFILSQSGQQQAPSPNGQQQPHQNGVDPRVANVVTQQSEAIKQLNQRLEQMQQQQLAAQVEQTVINPFKAAHPRFDELAPQIETILKSGLVPQNLTELQKLEAAYDMAERLNPRSVSPHLQPDSGPDEVAKRGNPAGEKSIKGAPTPGTDPSARKGQKLDRKAAIKAAMAEIGL